MSDSQQGDSARPGLAPQDSSAPRRSGSRRRRRRVVVPGTSGQPEQQEARPFRSASADGEAPSGAEVDPGAEAEASEAAGEEKPAGEQPRRPRVVRRPEGEQQLSARDRWFLEQRPPHW